MDYLPIFADVRNRRVLVIGGGAAARRKVDLLRRAGADVRAVGATEFQRDDVRGCVAVFGATGDVVMDRRVAEAANAAGVLVNIVDRPELSTFIMPAIVDRSPVIVALSSGATAPVLARRLRARIEALLPARLGDLARFAGRFRGAVRHVVQEPVARRRFWERFFDSPLADLLLGGDERAHAEMLALVNRPSEGVKGAVYVVGTCGDPDLLTLQALRWMQQADVVFHDTAISPEILDQVRRDADRVSMRGMTDPRVAHEAARGKRVVRLVAEPRWAEIAQLRQLEIEVLVAPVAWPPEERRRAAV